VRFEHSAIVDGSPEEVFSLTQDYARRLTWDPFLQRAELVGGATAPAVGVRAWCVSSSGIAMETEYVSYQPPRVVAVKMTQGPRLLATFGGTWEFEPVGKGKTRVTFRYAFSLKPRWLAWLLEPIARAWFAAQTRLRVAALADALRVEWRNQELPSAGVRLAGYGLRPWREFELDPSNGRYARRRLRVDPSALKGWAGVGQELSVVGRGRVLCSLFAHDGEIVVGMGDSAWYLFQPGLTITHTAGAWRSELSICEPDGKQTTFRYRRADPILAIIDSTYDDLDFELGNLPATLPAWAHGDKAAMLETWSAGGKPPA
jgi:ribosome-associated toxin RatA of RatAB toxin-antitoxin module